MPSFAVPFIFCVDLTKLFLKAFFFAWRPTWIAVARKFRIVASEAERLDVDGEGECV